jgi:cytochrome c biogenesis protein CcmG/thiol:disulfide interchange protein DsbE
MIERLFRICQVAVSAAFLSAATASSAATYETLDLNSYKGKVVLVDFWASWCAPCKDSFPWMQQILSRYSDRGLVVVAINVDRDRHLAEQFLNLQNPSFPIVFDPQAKLAERFKVSGMPASFYIDRSGAVRFAHVGFRVNERDDAERELAKLLSEQ